MNKKFAWYKRNIELHPSLCRGAQTKLADRSANFDLSLAVLLLTPASREMQRIEMADKPPSPQDWRSQVSLCITEDQRALRQIQALCLCTSGLSCAGRPQVMSEWSVTTHDT